jgi:hypothetical protein
MIASEKPEFLWCWTSSGSFTGNGHGQREITTFSVKDEQPTRILKKPSIGKDELWIVDGAMFSGFTGSVHVE